MLQGLSDEQLVAEIAQGRQADTDVEEQCTEFYRRYSAYVRSIVRSIVENSSLSNEVADLSQEVFSKLFRDGLSQYKGEPGTSLKGFLRSVTKNRVMSAFRARKRDPKIQEAARETSALGETRLQAPGEGWERKRLIMEILAELADVPRTKILPVAVVILSIYGEMTDRQIGSLFDMTEDAVRKQRTRACAKLRELLKKRNLGPEDVP